jgi:hypothetical protein
MSFEIRHTHTLGVISTWQVPFPHLLLIFIHQLARPRDSLRLVPRCPLLRHPRSLPLLATQVVLVSLRISSQQLSLVQDLNRWSRHPLPTHEIASPHHTSSTRFYWANTDTTDLKIGIPVGVSVPMGDLTYAPRGWGERY